MNSVINRSVNAFENPFVGVETLEKYSTKKILRTLDVEFYDVSVNDYVVIHYHDKDIEQHSVYICKVVSIDDTEPEIHHTTLQVFWMYNNDTDEPTWKRENRQMTVCIEQFSPVISPQKYLYFFDRITDDDVEEVHLQQFEEPELGEVLGEPIAQKNSCLQFYKLPIIKGFEYIVETRQPNELNTLDEVLFNQFQYDSYRNIMNFV
jgi:hypothetical protein